MSHVIVIYKFNKSTDTLPTFNEGFLYSITDVDNEDNTITRTIESDELPNAISFMSKKGLLEINEMNTDEVTDLYGAFYQCTNLTYVNLSKSNFSKVETIEGLFNSCSKLSKIDGLNSLDVSNVHNMGGVFSGCKALMELDISNWNTSKVSNMGAMFRYCSKISSININDWNVDSVEIVTGMFQGCTNLQYLDLSNLKFNVDSISQMFYQCTNLKKIDMSNWSLPDTIGCNGLFSGCDNLKIVKVNNCSSGFINLIIDSLPIKSANSCNELDICYIKDSVDNVNIDVAKSKYWNVCDIGMCNIKVVGMPKLKYRGMNITNICTSKKRI